MTIQRDDQGPRPSDLNFACVPTNIQANQFPQSRETEYRNLNRGLKAFSWAGKERKGFLEQKLREELSML